MTHTAQITASHGRHFTIRTDTGQSLQATTRKKRVDYACGDHVRYTPINPQQAVIEEALPRQSILYRQDAWRTKLIAANVSQLFIVIAAVPTPSERLIQRALIAAEAAHIQATLILNKADLPQTADWQAKLQFYTQLGYPLITLSAHSDISPLRQALQGHTAILLGQSGMGKSTLTNALLGSQVAKTNTHSDALDSGRHTTTHAQMYPIDADTWLIDSPGLQEFGLHHIPVTELIHHFPDLRHLHGQCRFHNCTHRREPNCALKAAAEHKHIRPERLQLLQDITDELSH